MSSKFDLFAISDREFEELCCDILSVKYGVDAKLGKAGRDCGVDGVLMIDGTRVAVQAKQYAADNFSRLYSVLKESEVEKASRIPSMDRYVLMTSCELSDENRRKIVELYGGVIKEVGDVWSGADIRAALARPEYDWVKRRHHNLWLQGVDVLEEFVGGGISAKSADVFKQILQDIEHSVKISAYDNAYSLLKTGRVIIITGQAGTGKTVLAKQLVVDSVLCDGYRFIASESDISVCDRELSLNPDSLTLFYIDDFLGANCLEALTNSKDSKIVNFIRRVCSNERSRLILTSRTNIIKEALETYKRFDLLEVEKYRFQLLDKDLDRLDKARMLYSMMYYGDVPLQEKSVVRQDGNYFKIIDHRNFNPRIMSYCFQTRFASDALRTSGRNGFERIKWMMDNPSEIWRDCFAALTPFELDIILIVFLAGKSKYSVLEKAAERLLAQPEYVQYRAKPFAEVIRQLCRSVLSGVISNDGGKALTLTLFNPSVGDYIIANCAKNSLTLAHLALAYSDIETAEELWMAKYFWKRRSPEFERIKADAGEKLLELLIDDIPGYDVDFVLGTFIKINGSYCVPKPIIERFGDRIWAAGIVFSPAAPPKYVAEYLHSATFGGFGDLNDSRITKEFLDGLFFRLYDAKFIAMLHRVYEARFYDLPEGYFEKIKEHGQKWADEIAAGQEWTCEDADSILEKVACEIDEFLLGCDIPDDKCGAGDCCDSFDPDQYVPNGVEWDGDYERYDLKSGLAKPEEDRIIERMFA